MGKKEKLARQIAGLPESIPQDFDPEEDRAIESDDEGNGSQDSDDEHLGTEHYLEVGKSKIRKRDEVALGPQYAGSKVSRRSLESIGEESPNSEDEDAEHLPVEEPFADLEASDVDMDDADGEIDSDEAFGESDKEKFKGFTFRGSGAATKANGSGKHEKRAGGSISESEDDTTNLRPNRSDSSEYGEDGEDDDAEMSSDGGKSYSDSDEESFELKNGSNNKDHILESFDTDDEDDESDSGGDEVDDEAEKARRAELRKIMNEEQKTVVATISQAAKADEEKGLAVKQQRKTFDSLLNVRIRLQKALIASNSMMAVEEKGQIDSVPYRAAEEAALKLLNTLDALRQAMNVTQSAVNAGGKRKRPMESSTSSSEIWKDLQEAENAVTETRKSTLEKWSARVRDATTLPISSKLNNTARQQTITEVLQQQLSSPERLIKRTKMPRSCAPVQASLKVTEDPHIYDDADFYQLLLKELVDQRMMDSSNTSTPFGESGKPIAQWTAVKEAKVRSNVDTRASKGRKMRYTVHEKLQNFMAPEDRRSWEQDAVDRLFGNLLGQKMDLGENDADEARSEEGDDGLPLAEEALILFRS